jgi:hypothetical protein
MPPWLSGEYPPFKRRGAGSIPAGGTKSWVRGATDERSGLLSRWLRVRISPHPPSRATVGQWQTAGLPSRQREFDSRRSLHHAGMAERPRHRASNPRSRVRLPVPALTRGSRPEAGPRPLKPPTSVRIAPPPSAHRSRPTGGHLALTQGMAGSNPSSGSISMPAKLTGEHVPCKRGGRVRAPTPASPSTVG